MPPSKSNKHLTTQAAVHDPYHYSSTAAQKPLRGRRGRLTRLPDLPLDILFVIFGYLHPLDLLRLARSWKRMRVFLMNRSSKWIWRHALSRVGGLPDCPSNMSEPEYANLMFSSLCHYCGTERAPTIIWSTRSRSCSKCFPYHFQRAQRLRQSGSFSSLPDECWEFARLTGKIVHNTSFAPITSRDTCQNIVSIDILQQLSEEHAIARRRPQELEMWLNKTRLDHAAWAVVADGLAAWHHNQAQKRGDELAAARQRRLDAIIQNLISSGYGDVVDKMDLDLLRHHKLVRKTGELTERVWANIKPSLIDFMGQVEAKLREDHRLEQITRRRRLFAKYISDKCPPRYYTSVPISELSQVFPIKSVIEFSPVDQVITFDDFPPPDVILMLSSMWHHQKRLELVKIMQKSPLHPLAVTAAHLDLATTFFLCDGPGYREPIGQQDVLIHPAAFARRPDREYNSALVARLFDDLQQEFWNFGGDRISFHEGAYLAARSIVAAGGYDPNTTTAATMDGSSCLFECMSCRCSADGRLVMSWRRAVMHAIDHIRISRQLPPPKWIRLDSNDPYYATAVAQIVSEEPFFRCHICNLFGDAVMITNHIRERHILYQTVTVMRQPHSPVRIPCHSPLLESGDSLDDSVSS